MKRTVQDYVQDILDEMDRVERFIEGVSMESLRDDELRMYAVSKAFENMGEAAKHVPESLRVRHPEVMWREMAGMRDRIAHAYWGMELRFGWMAVQERFPIERPALLRLLAELDSEAG